MARYQSFPPQLYIIVLQPLTVWHIFNIVGRYFTFDHLHMVYDHLRRYEFGRCIYSILECIPLAINGESKDLLIEDFRLQSCWEVYMHTRLYKCYFMTTFRLFGGQYSISQYRFICPLGKELTL